jgi:hypothetical protein
MTDQPDTPAPTLTVDRGPAGALTESEVRQLAAALQPILDHGNRARAAVGDSAGEWVIILPINRVGYPWCRSVNGYPVLWTGAARPMLAWRPA